jgi:hypothetical protein
MLEQYTFTASRFADDASDFPIWYGKIDALQYMFGTE